MQISKASGVVMLVVVIHNGSSRGIQRPEEEIDSDFGSSETVIMIL